MFDDHDEENVIVSRSHQTGGFVSFMIQNQFHKIFSQDVNKIALDDQQTLALNELLLQLEELKRSMGVMSQDNHVLRSQVGRLCIIDDQGQGNNSQSLML